MMLSKKYICFRALVTTMLFVAVYTVSVASLYAERKIFTFSADSTTANLAEGKEFTLLSGNAEVTADDVLITAGEIKLYGDDFQFAEVGGRFKALDLKNDFSLEGDRLFYDRQEKLLRAEGNVVMQDSQNDVVIRARFLESKEDGKFMVVQLGVKITKKEELSARSEFLTYYRETEILELSGFPYALWKDDEYSAERVSINLDNDEVHLEGKVKGTISTRNTEEEEEPIPQEQTVDETTAEGEEISETTAVAEELSGTATEPAVAEEIREASTETENIGEAADNITVTTEEGSSNATPSEINEDSQ